MPRGSPRDAGHTAASTAPALRGPHKAHDGVGGMFSASLARFPGESLLSQR